jgi:hypothetical protein
MIIPAQLSFQPKQVSQRTDRDLWREFEICIFQAVRTFRELEMEIFGSSNHGTVRPFHKFFPGSILFNSILMEEGEGGLFRGQNSDPANVRVPLRTS